MFGEAGLIGYLHVAKTMKILIANVCYGQKRLSQVYIAPYVLSCHAFLPFANQIQSIAIPCWVCLDSRVEIIHVFCHSLATTAFLQISQFSSLLPEVCHKLFSSVSPPTWSFVPNPHLSPTRKLSFLEDADLLYTFLFLFFKWSTAQVSNTRPVSRMWPAPPSYVALESFSVALSKE